MRKNMTRKLSGTNGISRLVALLLVLIAVLAVVIGIPIYRGYKEQADAYACGLAVDKAQDMLDIETLQGGELTLEAAQEIVDQSRIARENLCPVNGEYFVLEYPERENPFEVVCGLHDSDTARRTRLCSERILDRVQIALQSEHNKGNEFPEQLSILVNGQTLTAELVTEETGLQRGTSASSGYKGTVLFYGLAGRGVFLPGSGVQEGELFYLSYADENHCANWSAADGWSGDSWSGVSNAAGA